MIPFVKRRDRSRVLQCLQQSNHAQASVQIQQNLHAGKNRGINFVPFQSGRRLVSSLTREAIITTKNIFNELLILLFDGQSWRMPLNSLMAVFLGPVSQLLNCELPQFFQCFRGGLFQCITSRRLFSEGNFHFFEDSMYKQRYSLIGFFSSSFVLNKLCTNCITFCFLTAFGRYQVGKCKVWNVCSRVLGVQETVSKVFRQQTVISVAVILVLWLLIIYFKGTPPVY